MSFFVKIDPYFKIVASVTLILLIATSVFTLVQLEKIRLDVAKIKMGELSQNLGVQPRESTTVQEEVCGSDCEAIIDSKVTAAFGALPKVTGAPATTVVKTTQAPRVTYIPMDGELTSTNTQWEDAPGTDVYIDLKNDYGANAKVSWEASLKVGNANGQAFARLFDATHGIAVVGSEISVTNKDTFTQVSAGDLSFWAGRNLYRVQLKSLNSSVVTYTNGKIKIVY